MSVALLDVNVLVALFDSDHVHHEAAHVWFESARETGWATCPVTENGFVRVVSNPAYHPKAPRPAEAVKRLASLCEDSGHRFWTEDLSLRDAKRFASRLPLGSRQVTEAYLLALAVRHSGMLATFDRGIPLGAVLGATHRSLVLLSA